jgi:hypothetical protein
MQFCVNVVAYLIKNFKFDRNKKIMIKKITLLCAFAGLTAATALAQNNARLVTVNPSMVDAAPSNYTARQISTPNQTQALFDIQFNYNATDTVGRAGMAGVVYTGTEFWVSRYTDDTLYSFSPGGSVIDTFKIPGVTGIRGMTWDGTYIYAGINTTSIKKINPVTKTVVSSFTNAAGINVRHITYDSTANGGAGGFWIGNFNTNLVQISMTGATLQTIPSTTHGLTGMYGSAIDHWTAGGPYLWIFDQGSGGNQGRLVRLDIASGTPSGLIHNVMSDVGPAMGLSSGIAGGLFISSTYAPTRTIMGIIQGTAPAPGGGRSDNILFGYELNDYIPPTVDAQLDSLRPSPPYIMYPLMHYTTPLNWSGVISNQGTNTLTATDFVMNVKNGATTVFSYSTTANNMTTFSTANVSTSGGPSASTTGTFTVKAWASVQAPQSDQVHNNDTLKYTYMVTDTVFAREDGNATGSLGIGNGSGGILGQKFTTTVPDYITSVTMQLNAPTAGDSTRVTIHGYTTTPGNTVLASTPWYKFTAADAGGVVLTLPIIGGPFSIAPGTYFAGATEVTNNVTLATTDFNFNPNSSWIKYNGNWLTAESAGFNKTFLLRLNVKGPTAVGLKPDLAGDAAITVYPNPSSNQLTVEIEKNTTGISVVNILGEEIYHTAVADHVKTLTIDLNAVPSGIYFVKAEVNGKIKSSKVIVSK